jgi:archaemetzincin
MFEPPDEDARAEAIGTTSGLSAVLQTGFRDDGAFDPIPRPRGSDWLANHFERGQTFEQYLRSYPNRPDQQRNKIYLQPLGQFPESAAPDLAKITEFATAFFQLPVQQLPPMEIEGLPIQTRARQDGPSQLYSIDVLDWLRPRVPDDGYCLLAITMEDLYPDPAWNFVFGQASLRDRVGVYSFARYDPAFYQSQTGNEDATKKRSLILERSCKVLAHETGHMFGITHCVHFHCLMNGSNHLQETDLQPIHLCPVCLRKLHAAIGFDVVARYEQLREFSESAAWVREKNWLVDRLDELKRE